MTAAQALALVLVLAALAPAAGTAAAGAAWLARLWFRHQVEAIRDDGVLAVLDGVLPRTPAVGGYLAALGGLAACPRWPAITAAAALPAPASEGLTPGQQEIMDCLARRVRAAARSCLTWGRPARLLRAHRASARCPDWPSSSPAFPAPAKDHRR